MSKIIKVGSWDKNGNPTGWELDLNEFPSKGYMMKIGDDGRVFVGDVEMVEWTEARRKAIHGDNTFVDCVFGERYRDMRGVYYIAEDGSLRRADKEKK